MPAFLDDPKVQSWSAPLLLAVSVAALGTAFHAQFALGLEPCPLCLYQRIPYAVVGLLAAVALIRPQAALRRMVVRAAAVAFLAGAAIALYHVGVEQHWWASAVCGGQLPDAKSTDDFLKSLQAPPEKSCDEVDWAFLGVSMATYNAVASAGLAVLCLAAARRMNRR